MGEKKQKYIRKKKKKHEHKDIEHPHCQQQVNNSFWTINFKSSMNVIIRYKIGGIMCNNKNHREAVVI